MKEPWRSWAIVVLIFILCTIASEIYARIFW